ncbi:MAG: hemolysin family protein [Candidatus Aminicenantaceae bacterium]
MLISGFILFIFFLLLSAFFSSSETAFIASSPHKLDHLEVKGDKRAKLAKKLLSRIDYLLATILIGNTLVNTAAASIATFIFILFIPDKNQAVLFATITATILILFLAEIIPKTYAAQNPLNVTFLFVHPLRIFMIIFYPLVKIFTFFSRLIFRSSREKMEGLLGALDEDELKIMLTTGKIKEEMSSLRRKMISGVLDIGSRPIKEIMIPRPQIRAIEISSSFEHIVKAVLSSEFSRLPVYKGRLDNIEGLIHAKDIIPYLIEKKEINIHDIIRKPFFIPESASVEKVLLQMQKNTVHLAFVVDEFGNMEGIVTLEDIIEEIVGEIQDEYDIKAEDWLRKVEKNVYLVKGDASIKDINQRLPLELPEKVEYTTLAGFFLYEFGKIPQEKDVMNYIGNKFVVERMNRRHISLVRIVIKATKGETSDENHSH